MLASAVGNYIRDSVLPRLIPIGGATGTVLGKSSATNYAVGWITPSAGAGGTDTQIQYNASGVLTGAAGAFIQNGDIVLTSNNAPTMTTNGQVKLSGVCKASRGFLSAVSSKGTWHTAQPSFIDNQIAMWNPPGNATTVPAVFAMGAVTALGTATARSVATTNILTRHKRLAYLSSTTAGNFGGHYSTVAQYSVGNGSGLGGFYYSCTFAFTDAAAVSGVRAFVGLSSSVATPTNVEPNAIVNALGVAQLSTDTTQLYLVYGGSAAQTAIALGTNFPPMQSTGATGGTTYTLTLFSSASENGIVYYRLERIGTTYFVEGTLTPTVVGTQTPASTTLLAHRAWRCNNATALAAAIDVMNVYMEN